MQDSSELAAAVRCIIADRLDIDEALVTPRATIVDDLGASSVAILELTLALEDELDVEVSDDDVERIRTVGDIIECLRERWSDE